MKKWMMPRVGIEPFSSQEYIAACAFVPVTLPSWSSSFKGYAWDVFNDRNQLVTSGSANGFYRSTEYIKTDGFLNNTSGYTLPGWYTNKVIYRYKKNADNYSTDYISFTNTSYFKAIGTYDVYVLTSGELWIYPNGTASANGSPALTKKKSYS